MGIKYFWKSVDNIKTMGYIRDMEGNQTQGRDEMNATLIKTEETIKCPCCDNGYIPMYKHINGGICYHCDGVGFVTETVYDLIAQKTGKPTLEEIQRQEQETDRWYSTLTIKLAITNDGKPLLIKAYDQDGNAQSFYEEMCPLYELDEEKKEIYRQRWARAKAAGAKMKKQIIKNGIKRWIDA